MPDPIVFPAAALVLAVLPGREGADVSGGGPTPPSDGQWGFPMHAWRSGTTFYAPTQSDGYAATKTAAHREHHGADLMYRRIAGGPDSAYPAGTFGAGDARQAQGTKNYFCPAGVINVCAARDGTIWTVAEGGHGKSIVIDHGKPFATFYTHMSSVRFPMLSRGAGGIRVVRGQPIGIVGHSMIDAQRLVHLHFEIWYKGGSESHVDPWPLISGAPLPPIGGVKP